MPDLFHSLEAAAARGAAGLDTGARETVCAALRALQGADGGFAGLDGRSDPYYTLFAWLGLRALGAPCDRGRLCAYMAAWRGGSALDARCARFVLAAEGARRRRPYLRMAAECLRGDAYGAFLSALTAGTPPRWLTRLGLRRMAGGAGWARRLAALPTPRLAAGLVLATLAGTDDAAWRRALETRRCPGGGYAAAPGAGADLLATAVARFALSPEGGTEARDLAFVEACWMADGLFGASPTAARGDAEHTFYALLALGGARRG